MKKTLTQNWIIYIAGYGSFFFKGDEKEAEEMRKHKANWEQGIGRKRLADVSEIKSKKIDYCKNHPGFAVFGYNTKFRCDCNKCSKLKNGE